MPTSRGWEFFSHGIYNTRYCYGMDEAQERAIIENSIPHSARGERARPSGAGSPRRSPTPRARSI